MLWLRPIVQQLIRSPASAIIRAAVQMSDSGMPVISDAVRRVVRQERRHGVPAVGVLGNEFKIYGATVCLIFQEQVQRAVEQRQVGAGLDLQEQVGADRPSSHTGWDGSPPCSSR